MTGNGLNSKGIHRMKRIETLLEHKYDIVIRDIQPMCAGNTTDKYRVMTDTNTFVLRIRSAGFN